MSRRSERCLIDRSGLGFIQDFKHCSKSLSACEPFWTSVERISWDDSLHCGSSRYLATRLTCSMVSSLTYVLFFLPLGCLGTGTEDLQVEEYFTILHPWESAKLRNEKTGRHMFLSLPGILDLLGDVKSTISTTFGMSITGIKVLHRLRRIEWSLHNSPGISENYYGL